MKYTPIIGMEVHVELSTRTKMFCACHAAHFLREPNTQTCPVCLGLPGALPVPNKSAIESTIKIGLALGCQINLHSKFDRKHYFYPDLPKGYQISQYDQPLCHGGSITLASGRKIRITRVHLEEDTGKLQHVAGETLIDFNRSGVPLVEIVTEPDLSSADEAKEYLKLIHSTVRFLGVSDADMEKGSMRLEANISVSTDNSLPDYKIEVKNVNSFRYIAAAIDFEIARQSEILKQNQVPIQETRGWSTAKKATVSQRVKESAKDYRYFPEPDIPKLEFTAAYIDQLRVDVDQVWFSPDYRQAYIDLGVRPDYATVISESGAREALGKALTELEVAKKVGIEVNSWASAIVNKTEESARNKFKLESDMVKFFEARMKQLRADKLSEPETSGLVEIVIKANPKVVLDYRNGKTNAIQFLLGHVMAQSKGKADPQVAMRLLEHALKP